MMTPQAQTLRGSADERCLKLVVRSIGVAPVMTSCIDLVAERPRDAKRRVRFFWRRK